MHQPNSFPWKRTLLCLVAIISPILFPWLLATFIGIIAALFVPPIAIMLGIMFDLLYYTGGVPYFSIAGLVVAGIAFVVHRFIKTRIIS